MRYFLKAVRNFQYDMLRYLCQSGVLKARSNPEALSTQLMIDAHRIEKGLALPDPRPGFGIDVVDRLVKNVDRSLKYQPPTFATNWALSVLLEYCNFNRQHDLSPPEWEQRLKIAFDTLSIEGGVIQPKLVPHLTDSTFRDLAMNRHSVRNFSDAPVDLSLIHSAIEIAAKTPSVCNRQSVRTHYISTPTLRQKALLIQGGSRGFSENIPELIIITSDLKSFVTPAERYQMWVDGGLFAMSLVYALTAHGLGTCMLNWSVDPSRDRALRDIVDIPSDQNIIVFLAIGHPAPDLRVARSPRICIADLMTTH